MFWKYISGVETDDFVSDTVRLIKTVLLPKAKEYSGAIDKEERKSEDDAGYFGCLKFFLIDCGCLHLAESLGETKLYEQLKGRYDFRSLFELTSDEFIQERARLETLFENLRRDYIFENSRPLVA